MLKLSLTLPDLTPMFDFLKQRFNFEVFKSLKGASSKDEIINHQLKISRELSQIKFPVFKTAKDEKEFIKDFKVLVYSYIEDEYKLSELSIRTDKALFQKPPNQKIWNAVIDNKVVGTNSIKPLIKSIITQLENYKVNQFSTEQWKLKQFLSKSEKTNENSKTFFIWHNKKIEILLNIVFNHSGLGECLPINPNSFLIKISLQKSADSIEDYRNKLDQIYDTLRHEILHAVFLSIHPKGGSPKFKNPLYDFYGNKNTSQDKLSHPERDIEFKTLLNDAVEDFKRRLPQIPREHFVPATRAVLALDDTFKSGTIYFKPYRFFSALKRSITKENSTSYYNFTLNRLKQARKEFVKEILKFVGEQNETIGME